MEKLYKIKNGELVEVLPDPIKQPEPMRQTNGKKLLSVQETMIALGLGRNVVSGLLNTGEIKAFKIGRKWGVPVWAIDEFINKAR